MFRRQAGSIPAATGGWAAKQQLLGSYHGNLLGLIAQLGR